jgi:hypothetical protein
MNRQQIEIDVLLTLKDYLRANYWFLFKKFKMMVFLLLFVGGVYPLYYFMGNLSKNPNDSYWGFLIPWLILFFLIGATYLGAKRQMSSNKVINETHHYIFSSEGIKAVSASTSWQNAWDNIREVFETKSNFLLFIALNQMYVIPKRCFQNDEQINLFRELLKGQLASKAKIK